MHKLFSDAVQARIHIVNNKLYILYDKFDVTGYFVQSRHYLTKDESSVIENDCTEALCADAQPFHTFPETDTELLKESDHD